MGGMLTIPRHQTRLPQRRRSEFVNPLRAHGEFWNPKKWNSMELINVVCWIWYVVGASSFFHSKQTPIFWGGHTHGNPWLHSRLAMPLPWEPPWTNWNPTQRRGLMHASIHPSMHACMHPCIHTYIHVVASEAKRFEQISLWIYKSTT